MKFAWLPTHMADDYVVWLEFYFIEERWNEDGEDLDYPSSHGARIVATGAAWRRLRTFAQPKT